MAKDFDRFMVVNEIAGNPKIARLTDAEFRCLIQGVWPLASKSQPRGYLLVGSLPAEDRDIANQARCSVAVARRTMKKLRELEMVVRDEELGVECCHDWDEINPKPKVDATNAERQRRYRQRLVTLRNAVTNGDVTPLKLEGEEGKPPQPPLGGNGSGVLPPGPRPNGSRKTDIRDWENQATAFAHHLLPHLEPRQAFGELGVIWMRMGPDGYSAPADEVRKFIAKHKPHLLEGANAA